MDRSLAVDAKILVSVWLKATVVMVSTEFGQESLVVLLEPGRDES